MDGFHIAFTSDMQDWLDMCVIDENARGSLAGYGAAEGASLFRPTVLSFRRRRAPAFAGMTVDYDYADGFSPTNIALRQPSP
jgi:hypothetical protein